MFLVNRLGGISLFSILIATSLFCILSLASFLLRCRVFHFSVSSMVSTLDLFPCLLQTYLTPLRWTISRVCTGMSFCVYRSNTVVDAYSTVGLTSELYAFCFVVVDPLFRFLRRNPSVLLALSHMLLMWFVQRRSDVMSHQGILHYSQTLKSGHVVYI